MADNVGWAGSRQPKLIRPPLVYREACASMLAFAILMVLALDILVSMLALPAATTVIALLIHALMSSLALAKLGKYPHRHFGLANMTTAFRAALTAATGGIVLAAATLPAAPVVLWTIAAAAAISLALDGLDGMLARRNGTVSRYGARFDMEVDALLILLLAMAVYLFETAGAWVLLIGLMRYAFLAAQAGLKSMRGELPESIRRKVICVVQGAALCLALVPLIHPALQNVLLAAALISLVYSFTADIAHLLRNYAPTRSVGISSSSASDGSHEHQRKQLW